MTSKNKADIEKYGNEVALKTAHQTLHNFFKVDVILRQSLFVSTLAAILTLVTSNQIVGNPFPVPLVAKFNHAPPFLYLLVALSVAGVYSLITTLASISVILKPDYSTKLLTFFVLGDVLILGLVDSAVGTAGGFVYVRRRDKGDLNWGDFCSVFDKFCGHVGASIAVSLIASLLLVLLAWHGVVSLQKRIHN